METTKPVVGMPVRKTERVYINALIWEAGISEKDIQRAALMQVGVPPMVAKKGYKLIRAANPQTGHPAVLEYSWDEWVVPDEPKAGEK